ncbi:hypothetical protein FG95_01992 [Sphingopyxis sp. LC363]|nr:hypothetical protein FG95_01992 [Sphingopyxis sp. LC363]
MENDPLCAAGMGRWQRAALTEGLVTRPLHHSLRERSPSPLLRNREDLQDQAFSFQPDASRR